MNNRSRKMTALFLVLSLVFSTNITAAAREAGADNERAYINEEAEVLATSGSQTNVPLVSWTQQWAYQEFENRTITITCDTPQVKVNKDDTITKDQVLTAIIESLRFNSGQHTYCVKYGWLWTMKDYKPVAKNFSNDCVSIDLISIRKAGTTTGEDITYTNNGTVIPAKGNQIIRFKVRGVNSKAFNKAKSNSLESEILLQTYSHETVSRDLITFGDGKYALYIEYDACVEFRGGKVTATSHHLAPDIVSTTNSGPGSDSASVTGDVDGSVGVACCLLKNVSGNWGPINEDTKSYRDYYWKDNTGITLKNPKMYNNKKVAAWNDSDQSRAPYFKIKMTYSKKAVAGDLLTSEQKAQLKRELDNRRFYFTIEPRRLSDTLITYAKNDPDKYYVKKLTYDKDKKTLKGAIQYRIYKSKKKSLNVRSLKNSGKKLRTLHEDNRLQANNKIDVLFNYNSKNGDITLYGINGYYGSAVINGDYVEEKESEDK